jgi:hypothetical protein
MRFRIREKSSLIHTLDAAPTTRDGLQDIHEIIAQAKVVCRTRTCIATSETRWRRGHLDEDICFKLLSPYYIRQVFRS